MTLSTVLVFAYLWAATGSPLGTDTTDLLIAGAIVFGGATLGKLVGIMRARRRLMQELTALLAMADRAEEARC
jgi:hypothetical protein